MLYPARMSVKFKLNYGLLIVPILLCLPFLLETYGLSLVINILIFALFAMSLNLLIGYTGLVSFNHASFFGTGAYTVAILSSCYAACWPILIMAAILAAALLAAVLGVFVLRSSGPYFLLSTLAFNQMLYALAWKWRWLTGGDDGLPGIPRPELPFGLSGWDDRSFYYLVLLCVMISYSIIACLLRSSFGRSLVGIRENESRMVALGYNSGMLKYLAYVIAAAFSGLAGALYVYFNGFISPQELNWNMSGLAILMVIIGGPGTMSGPIMGAGVLVLLQNLVSSYTERWPLIIGVIFVFCVMFLRQGIMGAFTGLLNRRGGDNESPGA